MSAHAPGFFSADWLRELAVAASKDSLVAQHNALTMLTMGFRNTETEESAWISLEENHIRAGLDATPAAAFTFVGDTATFNDLRRGFPFNRLVRQHRLIVEGDMRCCVQNWLLIYAVTHLAARLGH